MYKRSLQFTLKIITGLLLQYRDEKTEKPNTHEHQKKTARLTKA